MIFCFFSNNHTPDFELFTWTIRTEQQSLDIYTSDMTKLHFYFSHAQTWKRFSTPVIFTIGFKISFSYKAKNAEREIKLYPKKTTLRYTCLHEFTWFLPSFYSKSIRHDAWIWTVNRKIAEERMRRWKPVCLHRGTH